MRWVAGSQPTQVAFCGVGGERRTQKYSQGSHCSVAEWAIFFRLAIAVQPGSIGGDLHINTVLGVLHEGAVGGKRVVGREEGCAKHAFAGSDGRGLKLSVNM